MRRFLATILIVLVAAILVAIVFLKDGNEETTTQPSPHAIDQGE